MSNPQWSQKWEILDFLNKQFKFVTVGSCTYTAPFASSLSKVPTFKVANTPSPGPSPPLYHSNLPILLGWRTPTPPLPSPSPVPLSSGIYTETFTSPKPPPTLSVDMSRPPSPEPGAEVTVPAPHSDKESLIGERPPRFLGDKSKWDNFATAVHDYCSQSWGLPSWQTEDILCKWVVGLNRQHPKSCAHLEVQLGLTKHRPRHICPQGQCQV